MTFVHELQEDTNWCWIACYRMACSNYGISVPQQCEIAQNRLRIASCCPAGSNAACNQTLPTSEVPDFYQGAGLHASVIPVSEQILRSVLGAGSLGLVLQAYPAGYHFVLLTAFANNAYSVNDPKYPQQYTVTFQQMQDLATLDTAWRIAQ